MSKDVIHDASECHDPSCCHHHDHHGHDYSKVDDQATNLIDNSMVLSKSWSTKTTAPETCASIEERFRKGFLELGDLLAIDGVILGHLKGTVKVQSGAFLTLSVTRQGVVDIAHSADWNILESTNSINVTINILSICKVSLPFSDIENVFYEKSYSDCCNS